MVMKLPTNSWSSSGIPQWSLKESDPQGLELIKSKLLIFLETEDMEAILDLAKDNGLTDDMLDAKAAKAKAKEKGTPGSSWKRPACKSHLISIFWSKKLFCHLPNDALLLPLLAGVSLIWERIIAVCCLIYSVNRRCFHFENFFARSQTQQRML